MMFLLRRNSRKDLLVEPEPLPPPVTVCSTADADVKEKEEHGHVRREDSVNSLLSMTSVSSASSFSHPDELAHQVSFKKHIMEEDSSNTIQEYYLKRRVPGKFTGLDWQQDPRKKAPLLMHPTQHSPTDYATIRGTVIVHEDGKKWLIAKEMRRCNSEKWHKAPRGAAIPFFYKDKYVLVRQRRLVGREQESSSNSSTSSTAAPSWREGAMARSREFSASLRSLNNNSSSLRSLNWSSLRSLNSSVGDLQTILDDGEER